MPLNYFSWSSTRVIFLWALGIVFVFFGACKGRETPNDPTPPQSGGCTEAEIQQNLSKCRITETQTGQCNASCTPQQVTDRIRGCEACVLTDDQTGTTVKFFIKGDIEGVPETVQSHSNFQKAFSQTPQPLIAALNSEVTWNVAITAQPSETVFRSELKPPEIEALGEGQPGVTRDEASHTWQFKTIFTSHGKSKLDFTVYPENAPQDEKELSLEIVVIDADVDPLRCAALNAGSEITAIVGNRDPSKNNNLLVGIIDLLAQNYHCVK